MKRLTYTALATLVTLPVVVPSLASAQQLTNIERLLRSIGNLVRLALPIVMGLALLGFFWGLVKFIFSQNNEEAKESGKKVMIWSVVALFVMVSVWGLVDFIQEAVGINPDSTPDTIPTIPGL